MIVSGELNDFRNLQMDTMERLEVKRADRLVPDIGLELGQLPYSL